jgi:hypothetical protein
MGLSSIEHTFERIAAALDQIAQVLENWRLSQPGAVIPISPPPADEPRSALPDQTASASSPAAAIHPPATYAEVHAAVMALIQAKGHDAAKQLLAQFKAKSVKDVAAGDYGAIVAKASVLSV